MRTYVVKLYFRRNIDGTSADPLYEQQIWIVYANNESDARERLMMLRRREAVEFENDSKEIVKWEAIASEEPVDVSPESISAYEYEVYSAFLDELPDNILINEGRM